MKSTKEQLKEALARIKELEAVRPRERPTIPGTLGHAIRSMRKDRGMTQSIAGSLSRRISLSQIEGNKNHPTLKTIKWVADCLGCKVSDIILRWEKDGAKLK